MAANRWTEDEIRILDQYERTAKSAFVLLKIISPDLLDRYASDCASRSMLNSASVSAINSLAASWVNGLIAYALVINTPNSFKTRQNTVPKLHVLHVARRKRKTGFFKVCAVNFYQNVLIFCQMI